MGESFISAGPLKKIQLQGRREEETGKRFAPPYGAVDATLRSLGEAAYWVVHEGEWRHEEVAPSHERRRDGEAAGFFRPSTPQMDFFSGH